MLRAPFLTHTQQPLERRYGGVTAVEAFCAHVLFRTLLKRDKSIGISRRVTQLLVTGFLPKTSTRNPFPCTRLSLGGEQSLLLKEFSFLARKVPSRCGILISRQYSIQPAFSSGGCYIYLE